MTCSNIFIYLCPGYHSPALTDDFVSAIWSKPPNNLIIFPSDSLPPYSPQAVQQYLDQEIASKSPLSQPVSTVWIAFSAGVVGGVLAARQWQSQGKGAHQHVNQHTTRSTTHHKVSGFIAIDGWGVPLGNAFPVYRMSHDLLTYRSQALMGDRPIASFVAHPAVDHLQLWRSPDTVNGYLPNNGYTPKSSPSNALSITAAQCIRSWLKNTP
ncbi:MAG: hypothetical protein ACFCA4_15435 [Cyanophyceae cyanobacterium]